VVRLHIGIALYATGMQVSSEGAQSQGFSKVVTARKKQLQPFLEWWVLKNHTHRIRERTAHGV
jgi:hypothetical protein